MFSGRLSSLFRVFKKPGLASEANLDEKPSFEKPAALSSPSVTAKDVTASHKFMSGLRGRISYFMSYFFNTGESQGDEEESSPAPIKDPSKPPASVKDPPKEHTAQLEDNPALEKPVSRGAPKPDFVAVDIPEDVLQDLPPTELFPTRATKEMLLQRSSVGQGGLNDGIPPHPFGQQLNLGDDLRTFAVTTHWICAMLRKYHEVEQAVRLSHAVWHRRMQLREVDQYNRAHSVPSFQIQPIRFRRSSGDEMRQQLLKRNYHAEVSKAHRELHRQMPLYNRTVYNLFYRRLY